MTNAQCTPNTVHWVYDTYMLANSARRTALAKAGGDTWFFLTADYAFGQALERDTTAVPSPRRVEKFSDRVKHPLNSADFSSFLLQAQASKAKIIGLANAGGDTTNSIKQANEFGIVKGGQKLAGLLVFLPDVHALGSQRRARPQLHRNVLLGHERRHARLRQEIFRANAKNKYHAEHGAGRRLRRSACITSRRWMRMGGNPKDGTKTVVAKMKEMPTDDKLFGKGEIQVTGRKIHPAYLFEVKKPAESKGPFDYYKLVGTTPADKAFRPLSEESACPLAEEVTVLTARRFVAGPFPTPSVPTRDRIRCKHSMPSCWSA